MNNKKAKQLRMERKLEYLQQMENWLGNKPAWWRVFSRMKWRAAKPQLERR